MRKFAIPELQAASCGKDLEAGAKMTPVETVERMKRDMFTQVLATVHCPAWSLSWALAFVNLIAISCSACSGLKLLAVKGGDACDQEIAFIEWAMLALGFEAKVISLPSSPVDPTSLFWEWSI